jgi:RHS repeat-associated protein
LIEIDYPGSGNKSEFDLDAGGRIMKMVETVNSVISKTSQSVWTEGDKPKELRDGSGTIVSQFYRHGEVFTGGNYYWTKDKLGSIRELSDSMGNLQFQYSYNPYGKTTKISGSKDSDFQYDGYFTHSRSGLNLTVYRAYDSRTGRWLSRDPITEAGGINLYSYVGNSPLLATDPLGLAQEAGTGKCRSSMCCADIAAKIVNNVAELAKRHAELVNDIKNLPLFGPTQTIQSHQKKYTEIQGFLVECLSMYVAKGCNTPLPPDTDFWKKEPAPEPAPPAWDPRNIKIPEPPKIPNWVWVLGGGLLIPWPGNPVYGGL